MSCGVQLLRINSAVVWKESSKILAPWCQRLWDLRHSAATKAEDRWLKWILNSLTGKLGERAEKEVLTVLKPGRMPPACNGHLNAHPEGTPCPAGKCCQHRCVDACGRWLPIDRDLSLWKHKVWFVPKNSFPHWAAYLTSEARISLHKRLIEAGDQAVYCDTDSCYTTGILQGQIGDGLGEWKHEGTFENWTALAPKLYRYDEHDETVIRGKGFPNLDRSTFVSLSEGNIVDLGSYPTTWKTGIAKGRVWEKRVIRKRTHRIPGLVGSRKDNGDGTTSPLTVSQFAAILRDEKADCDD